MAGVTSKNAHPGVGNGDGFGVAKFGAGGESVRGVEVKVGDPQFTLLWNTTADIDLYVTEPGGKTIWWNERNGRQGGELDVDNTEGFGPENIYWLRQGENGTKELGPGPPGEYKWRRRVLRREQRDRGPHPLEGSGSSTPVASQFFEGKLNYPKDRSRTFSLKVGDASDDPGDSRSEVIEESPGSIGRSRKRSLG